MGMFFIYPAEYCTEEYDNELAIEQAIGTGPYKYSEYVIDDHVTMVKFEDYKPDEIPASGLSGERIAYFDKITWMIVPNAAQRLNGLVAGEYQYADDLDVSAWDTSNWLSPLPTSGTSAHSPIKSVTFSDSLQKNSTQLYTTRNMS